MPLMSMRTFIEFHNFGPAILTENDVLTSFFFFLVLCLPRQVCKSNGTIHHDVQLSPLTCCNPLSSFSPGNIILGLPLFFPSILPSIIVLSRESPLTMCPSQFHCWLQIIPISDLFHLPFEVALRLSCAPSS